MSGDTSDVLTRARVELRRTWLIWSVLPLVAFLLGLLATTAVYASAPSLSPKRAEDSFYALLAISALVFLFAFTIDGYWTNPKRVLQEIDRRTGETAAGEVAARIMVTSSSALGLMGHVIAFSAILCLIGGAGTEHAYLLLALAVSYHLFLFSRHPYYEHVVEAAGTGDLLREELEAKREKEKRKGKRGDRKD